VVSLLGVVSACEIEKVGIPATKSMVSLHGVLSASAPSQVVLLERTRNGTVRMFAPPFDLADPIISDEGVAESGAIVTLTTPDGETLTAVEDSRVRDDRKGEGIYRFSLPGSALIADGNYQLAVQTVGGEVLAAETSVPAGVAVVDAQQATFDRSRDTAVFEWPKSPGARSYFVRIETPFGPRLRFQRSSPRASQSSAGLPSCSAARYFAISSAVEPCPAAEDASTRPVAAASSAARIMR